MAQAEANLPMFLASTTASPDNAMMVEASVNVNMAGFGAIHPVSISARELSVTVASKAAKDRGQRTILNNVSLQVPQGQLMAIMGGSGSGKTTLLNMLAGRPVGSVTGEILFNGESPRKFHNSGMVAYVTQQDNLLPYVTVRETLRYAARLRLPRTMALATKYELVESVILELGLKECANTLVGDEWRKGISGGEKRRVSVGVQLLLNPSVIFMDEPTTGLDSFSARSLIETLVSLAHKTNRTIILSIHQPRSDIFSYFDQIALLARGGRLAYFGSPRGSVRFLESVGFPLLGDMNGADFIVDTIAVDDRTEESERITRENVDKILSAWDERAASQGLTYKASSSSLKASNATVISEIETVAFSSRVQGAGFVEQVSVLTRRMMANMWEDRLTLWGSVLEMIMMAVVIGLIFLMPNQDPSGMYNRKSALYICTAMQNYLGLMYMIYKLSLDMKVFDKERSDKMYSVTAYLISWVSVNFTLYGVLSVLFSVVVYFMVDLRKDNLGYHFGLFALNSVLQQWVTMAFAFVCVSFARDFATASLIGNSFFTFLSLSSGFFLPETAIPVYVRWFQWISYVTYGLRLYIANEFADHVFDCPSVAHNIAAAYAACDGNNLIAQTGFDASIGAPVAGLVALLAGKLLVAAAVLSLFPAQGDRQGAAVAAAARIGKTVRAVRDEPGLDMRSASSKPPRIRLELHALSLRLDARRSWLSAAGTAQSAADAGQPILQSIDASFPSGQLTAILGASGAGKSTLLSLLHSRLLLPSHLSSDKSGKILHNGVEFDKAAINACTASVRQDDSHLLPALTARETLVYAALLRLPNSWKRERKIQRAEEVLMELGLKECANTVVGGEGVKGLSGGEKRRLSVGLAMLMDPAILLLDEPTSGLDASSARNMMTTLKAIAAEGRTVICTIHQPRSDIFPLLDRILLLARGGRVVYQGPGSSLVPHLASQGHQLPELTNPADFALDMSSVDLRSDDAEFATRARVDALIEAWKVKAASDADEGPSAGVALLSGEETVSRVMALSAAKRLSNAAALPLLISRSFLNLRRQPGLMAARIMNEVALGVIFSLYYAKIADDQAGVISRIGLLQQTGSIVFIGMLNCISVFPQELLLFRFEHQDGTTTVESFFLTYTVNEIPFELVGATIYGLLATYLMGLHMNPGYMILMAFVNIFVGESIGIAFCTIFSKPGFSVQIMSAVISIFNQTQGFLSVSMPNILIWINYLSVLRYVSRILAQQEFGLDRLYACDPNPALPCQYPTGASVMDLFGFPSSDRDLMLNFVGLFVSVIVYRLLAYAVLKRQLP
ncbi:P-loop containing nucleoside triphosphate hydrolase protein [Chytriomyces sp. MP71]|nr:P-loop containing nucleoside triphosphate hydrolase protein [Chytriomyces sp. MP71]